MYTVLIYAITNKKDGELYIGSTSDPRNRFDYHYYLRKAKSKRRALRKKDLIFNVLLETNESERFFWEGHFIEKFKLFNYKLSNKINAPKEKVQKEKAVKIIKLIKTPNKLLELWNILNKERLKRINNT